VETLSEAADYKPGRKARPKRRSSITRGEERCRSSSTTSSAAQGIQEISQRCASVSSESSLSSSDMAFDEGAVTAETPPSHTSDYPEEESNEVERILEHKVVNRGRKKVAG
jgi:hypothetical protein